MSGDLSDTLRWIANLLAELGVPYQVVGGLAARAYGASRPLADIDLYVPDAALDRIASAAASHLTLLPSYHRTAQWDLTFMKVHHGGWQIEIAGADSARVRNHRAGAWDSANIRFDVGEMHEIEGIPLPVMPKSQLIEYKQGLDRDVDRQDLNEIST